MYCSVSSSLGAVVSLRLCALKCLYFFVRCSISTSLSVVLSVSTSLCIIVSLLLCVSQVDCGNSYLCIAMNSMCILISTKLPNGDDVSSIRFLQ